MKNGAKSTEECCQSVPPQGRQPQHEDGSVILRLSFGEESGCGVRKGKSGSTKKYKTI